MVISNFVWLGQLARALLYVVITRRGSIEHKSGKEEKDR
jgi:hypothetical protein